MGYCIMSFTLAETITVGAGGTDSITFTSIPDTASDIMILLTSRSSSTGTDNALYLTMNSDTASSYGRVSFSAEGSTISVLTNSTTGQGYAGQVPASSADTGAFGATKRCRAVAVSHVGTRFAFDADLADERSTQRRPRAALVVIQARIAGGAIVASVV